MDSIFYWPGIFGMVIITGVIVGIMVKKTYETTEPPKLKDIAVPIGILILWFFIGLFLLISKEKKNISEFADGYIITEGVQTNMIEDLFYQNNGRYMIELKKMDKALDLDVMYTANKCIISTSKHQIEIIPEERTYVVNLNTVKEDDNYLIPFVYNDCVYADTDTIFQVFGYKTEYQSNNEENTVELRITKTDGDPYETIGLQKKETEIQESKAQIEQEAAEQKPDINQPGNNTLPTVPYPKETTAFSEEKFLEEGGVYPDDIQEIIDNRPVAEPTLPQVIPKPEEIPNKMTDEEFENRWNESKNGMAEIFKSGNAATGTVPYKERSEDFIAFNPMNKAIYYDTISVLHNVGENVFMEVSISSEWSDLALNTDNAESIAFYECIPRMVEAAIKYSVGENAGAELFEYIKTHADKKTTGGYIATHDEHGDVVTVWSDGEVGDGIMSSELDLENWQGKTTDDGLTYYVACNGEGILIKIFKN